MEAQQTIARSRQRLLNKRMYPLAYMLLALLSCTSCRQEEKAAGITQQPTVSDTVTSLQGRPDNISSIDSLAAYSQLLPLTILDSGSTNVYEKYGIEFSGNCYECDLAAISISKKYFDIINVCDKNNMLRDEKFSYELSKDVLLITSNGNRFTFRKIDAAPVYELSIQGANIVLKNKRFSTFYTTAAVLKKFKQHDCGEFEG